MTSRQRVIVQSLNRVQLFTTPGILRLSCPSLSPGVCSNSPSLSLWCYQPSRPLSSPFSPALNLPQHQSLFQWVGFLPQVAKVLGAHPKYVQNTDPPPRAHHAFPKGLCPTLEGRETRLTDEHPRNSKLNKYWSLHGSYRINIINKQIISFVRR